MPTKKAKSDSTTKKWAAKPKTAKARDLGTGGASRAAAALKKRNKQLQEALGY